MWWRQKWQINEWGGTFVYLWQKNNEIRFVPHTVHKTNSQQLLYLNARSKTLSFRRHWKYFNGLKVRKKFKTSKSSNNWENKTNRCYICWHLSLMPLDQSSRLLLITSLLPIPFCGRLSFPEITIPGEIPSHVLLTLECWQSSIETWGPGGSW